MEDRHRQRDPSGGGDQDGNVRETLEQPMGRPDVLLEAVIRQSPIPMVLVTYPDLVVRIYNRACKALLGTEDEPDAEGRNLFEVEPTWHDLSPDDTEIPLRDMPLARALAGQRTEHEEYKVRRKDGTVRHEVVDGLPIYDEDGRLIAGFIIFPDITDLKRAETLLRAQYDLALRLTQQEDLPGTLRVCLESVIAIAGMDGGGIYLVDDKTGDLELAVTQNLSPEFRSVTSHYEAASAQAALVMAGAPIYLSGDTLLAELDEAGRREGLQAIAVLPVQHKGRVIAVINVASRRNEEVEPAARRVLEAVASQVGSGIAHARATEQLRQSEERYRNFIATAGEGIFRIDFPEPIPIDLPDRELESRIAREGVVGEANETLARMYGAPLEEIIGKSPLLFSRDGAARGLMLVRQPDHRATDIETADVDRQGRELQTNGSSIAVVENGCLVRIWGTKRDVTERKRAETERRMLEEQLRHSQKMEAIGRLAGGIAHDFNNILTGINGFAEIAAQGLDPRDPLRADLDEIRRAGERAVSLTNQLLSFSKRQVIELQVLDPNEVVRRSERMLRRLIGEDIELVFHPGRDLGSIRADPVQIDQILVNLAVNARDAMPRGGKLTIETENVTLDEEYARLHQEGRPGAFVTLSVGDNGRGMNAATRERIFEPFFTTKEKGKGTGLGLSTVYGIVQQSGGFINVYSEPGIGTDFKLYFPRVTEAASRADAGSSEHPPTGTETILLAEDEPMVRELARRILQRQGYTVIEAADGESACRARAEHRGRIDLLLTDVVMPMMNGPELYERLLAFEPALRVLFMSGYTETFIAHHGVLGEGSNFIHKPFSVDGLARRVRQVLDDSPSAPAPR